MATNKIRGDTQIQDASIPKEKFKTPLGLPLSQIEDSDELVKRDGSVPMTGDQSMGNKKLTNVRDPDSPQDAVNKRTLDTAIALVNVGGQEGPSFFQSRENGHVQLLKVGQPVCIVNGKFYPATSVPPFNQVVGLVHTDDIPPGLTGKAQIRGVVNNTPQVWDAGLPTVGGLSPDRLYFLSETGLLSLVPPSTTGQYVVPMGLALNASDMELRLSTFQILI